jgi:hypothetical protein
MVQVYRWRVLSFEPSARWVADYILPATMVALLTFGIGLFARPSAIAAAILLRIVYAHVQQTYALDHITLLVTTVFVVAPKPQALAVDVRLRKVRSAPLAAVPAWFAVALLLTIELVYGNSVLNKLRSVAWRDGLTFWLTMTLPHFSADRLPAFAKIPTLLRAATYVALALETFFPLVLVKPFRRWIVLVGAMLHLSIAVFLPIPFFGLGFAALYLFLVDWRPVGRRLGWSDVDASGPTDRRFERAGYALPAFLIVGELFATIPPRLLPASSARSFVSLFGLNNYGVYLDFHFIAPRPIVRIIAVSDGRRIAVPSFDERGFPEVTGRYWCNVAIGDLRWHPGGPGEDEIIKRYVAGWLERGHVSHADFEVYGRDVSIPLRMSSGLDADIEHRPWKLLGTGAAENGRVSVSWRDDAAFTTRGRLDDASGAP